jgi:uncharacterized protein (TIGR02453 family)
VYRDTRFAKDKAPYKINIGIQFRHEQAKDVHSPGYYVHIDPTDVFLGAGMWHPEAAALASIRRRIDAKQAEWRRCCGDTSFRRQFHLGGESLVRPPKGYGADHPLIDDLRRKDFIAVRQMQLTDAIDPHFQRTVESAFKAATPLMKFLCRAVGVQY